MQPMNDESLFRQAIERPPQTRSEFLAEACGDDDQRSRLEALVAAHQRDDSLLDTASEVNSDPGSVDPGLPDELGDFEILSELGRGGMGVVYKARQKSLNRIVALKVLSSGLGLSSRAILRFRREAEAAGKLHHTNIVPVYTTGEDRGIHYYAMEWIDGPSLDRVVKDLRQAESDPRQSMIANRCLMFPIGCARRLSTRPPKVARFPPVRPPVRRRALPREASILIMSRR